MTARRFVLPPFRPLPRELRVDGRDSVAALLAAAPSVEESGGFSFLYRDDPDDPDVVNVVNAGRCASCRRWTTDLDKPEVLHGLVYGSVVQGKLVCHECQDGTRSEGETYALRDPAA